MKMKRILGAVALAASVTVAHASDPTVAFWGFSRGEADAQILATDELGVINEIGTAVPVTHVENNGNHKLYYSSEAPGAYIYPSIKATTPYPLTPKSLRSVVATLQVEALAGSDLSKLTDFTVEFFYRQLDDNAKNMFECAFGAANVRFYPNQGKGQMFVAENTGSSSLNFVFGAVDYIDGVSTDVNTLSSDSAVNPYFVNDGCWHHLALVHSAAEGKLQVYSDYVLKGSVDYSHSDDAGFKMSLGGLLDSWEAAGTVNMRTTSLFSSIRISGSALSLEDFEVASSSPTKAAGDDQFLYLDFNAGTVTTVVGDWLKNSSGIANGWTRARMMAFSGNKKTTQNIVDEGYPPVYDDAIDEKKPFVFDGDRKLGKNLLCTELKVLRGSSPYVDTGVMTEPSPLLDTTYGDYTFEAYFRLDENPPVSEQTLMGQRGPKQGDFGCPAVSGAYNNSPYCWRATITTAGKISLASWEGDVADSSTWARRSTTTTEVSALLDGKWHHVAVIVRSADKSLSYYEDGKLFATHTLVNPLVRSRGSAYFGYGGSARGIDGWLDDVRITRRALTSAEFLSWKGAPGLTVIVR